MLRDREKERETERKIYRQTDRDRDRQTKRERGERQRPETGRHAVRQRCKKLLKQAYEQMNRNVETGEMSDR